MQKATRMLLLFVVLVFCAFLIVPKSVLAEEGAVKPISGKMEFIPAEGNNLGDVIILRINVSYDSSLLEFDQRQIPMAMNSVLSKLFRMKEVSHDSREKGNFITEIWEFKLQFLDGLPPLELEIPSLSMQYKERAVNYFSSFEIKGASVAFEALTSEDSPPDTIIKSLNFGPSRNFKAMALFGLGALLILSGIGLGVILLAKRQRARRVIQGQEPLDEYLVKYNLLCDSLDGGEDGLIVLHNLYLLLKSFYKERRGLRFKIGWQDDLLEEEKLTIEALQELYGETAVTRIRTRQLLQEAKKIIEK